MPNPNLYVLRLFDRHDGWINVTGPLPQAEAQAKWKERTGNGTHHTQYDDEFYFKVFPADTTMLYEAGWKE